MAVDSRAKGQRGEYQVRDLLRKYTGLQWERIPASGALSYLKGDLYVPHEHNNYLIEVKNYEEEALNTKVLTNKSSNLVAWWNKAVEQAALRDQKPSLFFKHTRSKIFVGVAECPKNVTKFMYINHLECYVMLAEDFLANEDVTWLGE